MCRFADSDGEPWADADFFTTAMGREKPGMAHYVDEVSYGALTLTQPDVIGWYRTQGASDRYEGHPFTWMNYGVQDCLNQADPDLDFPSYDLINVVTDSETPFAAGEFNQLLEFDGVEKRYRMMYTGARRGSLGYQGELSRALTAALGLGESVLSDDPRVGSFWDVASTVSWGCYSAAHPEWCVPVHPIAYWKLALGWISADDVQIVTAGETVDVVIPPTTATGLMPGPLMVKIPARGYNSKYLTLETRRWVGYDEDPDGDGPIQMGVPSEGVVIHRIGDTWHDDPMLVDGDWDGYTTTSAGATWTPGETYSDESWGIEVAVTDELPDGSYVVRVASPVKDIHSFSRRIDSYSFDRDAIGHISTGGPLSCVGNAPWHLQRLTDGRWKRVRATTNADRGGDFYGSLTNTNRRKGWYRALFPEIERGWDVCEKVVSTRRWYRGPT
jgi:hypothetical protein